MHISVPLSLEHTGAYHLASEVASWAQGDGSTAEMYKLCVQCSRVPVENSSKTPGLSTLTRHVETMQTPHRNSQSQESNPGNRCSKFIVTFYNLIMLDGHFQSCALSHKFTSQRCRSASESVSKELLRRRRPHLKHINPDLINIQSSLTPIKYREYDSGYWNQLV